jgi:hypothetical protein
MVPAPLLAAAVLPTGLASFARLARVGDMTQQYIQYQWRGYTEEDTLAFHRASYSHRPMEMPQKTMRVKKKMNPKKAWRDEREDR